MFKTITFFVQMLQPGQKTLPVKTTSSLLVSPFEGKGHSIVDGKKFDWNQFDTLAIPGGSWFEHKNDFVERPTVPVRRLGRADAEKARSLQEVGASQRRRSLADLRLIIRPAPARSRAGSCSLAISDELLSCRIESNTKLVSHIDCPGGGQVWVEGTTLYVGHMRPTSGTTIIDVADPRKAKIARQDSMCVKAGTRTRCVFPATS